MLTRDSPEDGFACDCRTVAFVTVDEGGLNKALKEGAPVCFGLAEGDADAEKGAVAGGGDAQCEDVGTIA